MVSAVASGTDGFLDALTGVLATFGDTLAGVLAYIAHILDDLCGSARHQA